MLPSAEPDLRTCPTKRGQIQIRDGSGHSLAPSSAGNYIVTIGIAPDDPTPQSLEALCGRRSVLGTLERDRATP
jgi:hypothetical protein